MPKKRIPSLKKNCATKGCKKKTSKRKHKYCDQCFQRQRPPDEAGQNGNKEQPEVQCLGCSFQIKLPANFCPMCSQRVPSEHSNINPASSEGAVPQIKKPPEADVAALKQEKQKLKDLASQPQAGHASSSAKQPSEQGNSGDQPTVLCSSVIDVTQGENSTGSSSSFSEESKKNSDAGQSVSKENREGGKDDDMIQYDNLEYMNKYGNENNIQVGAETKIIEKEFNVQGLQAPDINTLHVNDGYSGSGDTIPAKSDIGSQSSTSTSNLQTENLSEESHKNAQQLYSGDGESGDSAKTGSSSRPRTSTHISQTNDPPQKESHKNNQQPYSGDGASGDFVKPDQQNLHSDAHSANSGTSENNNTGVPAPPVESQPVFGNQNLPTTPSVGYYLRPRGSATHDHPPSKPQDLNQQNDEGSSVDKSNDARRGGEEYRKDNKTVNPTGQSQHNMHDIPCALRDYADGKMMTIYFHTILTPEFKFNPETDAVYIRFGSQSLGNFTHDAVKMVPFNYGGNYVFMTGTLVVKPYYLKPLSNYNIKSHFIEYKYVHARRQKNGDPCYKYEFIYKQTGKSIVNRALMTHRMHPRAGDI